MSSKEKRKHSSGGAGVDSEEEEERARKKASRKIEKVTKLLGYTNEVNPFGDSNLLEPFNWSRNDKASAKMSSSSSSSSSSSKKKSKSEKKASSKKDKKKDKKKKDSKKKSKKSSKNDSSSSDSSSDSSSSSDDSSSDDNKAEEDNEDTKRLKLLAEIEKVRKRRDEREKELEDMEKLRDEENRLRQLSSFGDWQHKEEEFAVGQIRVRTISRLYENKERTIDLLAKNIILNEIDSSSSVDDIETKIKLKHVHAETSNPENILRYLDQQSLKRLLEDVDQYIEYEKFMKKPSLEYWQALKLVVAAKISEYNSSNNSNSNNSNSNSNRGGSGGYNNYSNSSNSSSSTSSGGVGGSSVANAHLAVKADIDKMFSGKSLAEMDNLLRDIESNITGGRVLDMDYWEHMRSEATVLRSKLFIREFAQRELSICLQSSRKEWNSIGSDGGISSGKRQGSNNNGGGGGEGEEDGDEQAVVESTDNDMKRSDEVDLVTTKYAWSDKHRPRKPRFINIVRTGFSWNKYNSTHYDKENPPPKQVIGYKFTIFYPDLIDKSKTPRFNLTPSDDDDFVIIRFHAGPPYEDVAFKIINREWETNTRFGYRCSFDRGVYVLNFSLKRRTYRR